MHSCDNPPCCNPRHLSPGTRQDNVDDCVRKGRVVSLKGSTRGNAKLTEQQVLHILDLRENGATQRAIASKFGVHHSTVGAILKGKKWSHMCGRQHATDQMLDAGYRPPL